MLFFIFDTIKNDETCVRVPGKILLLLVIIN